VQVPVELRGLVDAFGALRDFLLRERMREAADLLLLYGKVEIHSRSRLHGTGSEAGYEILLDEKK
jgi:hypothetical protein